MNSSLAKYSALTSIMMTGNWQASRSQRPLQSRTVVDHTPDGATTISLRIPPEQPEDSLALQALGRALQMP